MTWWNPLEIGFWTSISTSILIYLKPMMLVLVADFHCRTFGNNPLILMAFCFVMNLIGRPCIWTQKEDRLKSILERAKFEFHSLRSKWVPFTDHGRHIQTLFRSCSFLKEKRKKLLPSCSILICSSVNQILLKIMTTTFLLTDLFEQILPTMERLESLLAPTSSATNTKSGIWNWVFELSGSLDNSIFKTSKENQRTNARKTPRRKNPNTIRV